MTDLRAIEIAIQVLKAVSPLVQLVMEASGRNGHRAEMQADEITAALFKLQRMHGNLSLDGVHHIEA